MKFNWGHGLLIAIIVCTGGLLLLVFLSSRQKVDLVTEEYYPKELVYEEEIQKLKNTNSLTERIEVEVGSDSLHIRFPDISLPFDSISGEIWFYFPADKTADNRNAVRLSEKYEQSFSLSLFRKGKYEVIIDWQAGQTNYLQKEIVFIN